MGLYFKKTLHNDLEVVVWRLTESLEDLEKEVKLEECYREAFDAISVPVKKREFLAGKFVLEKACAILNIDYKGIEKDEHGKPHLRGRACEISLTHTEEFIAVVFAKNGSVGIDLELPRQQIFRVLPRLYSQEEVEAVGNDLEKATIYWSAKEALYKLYGKRSVDFKKNLFLRQSGGDFIGEIDLENHKSTHQLIIDRVEEYFLVVAY
jgi:4'-phosphopantetheinyl transferase